MKECEVVGDLSSAKASVERYQSKIPRLCENIKKNTEKIKLGKVERERLLEDIKPKEKQLDLI